MRTVMVVILILLAFTLVACGGNDAASSDSGGEAVAGPGTPTPLPPPTATPWPTLPPTRELVQASHQGHIYSDGTSTVHTVQAGETLGQIANLYSVPIDLIANANRIYDTDSVEAGEVLFIPPCE